MAKNEKDLELEVELDVEETQEEEKKDLVEYTINFVGATPNQAQAINAVIVTLDKLKERDETPIAKYQSELSVLNVDFILFKDIYTSIANSRYTDLIERVEKRVKHYEVETKTREDLIAKHKDNIKYMDEYIAEIDTHIDREVDHENHVATYTYDMAYFKPFLDLANVVFTLSFEER